MQCCSNRQSGAVLAITMIVLLVMTLIVVSTSQDVVIQEKMTAAIRDTNVSLAAAESAMEEAEQFIESQTTLSAFGATDGLYAKDTSPSDLFDPSTWTDTRSIPAVTTIANVESRYFIEEVDIIPVPEEDLTGVNMMGYGQTTGGGDVNAFKIVTRGTGTSGTAKRVVVSYYGKRF